MKHFAIAALLTAGLYTSGLVSAAQAQDSVTNASKASGDSVVAVAELSEAGVKVVAGAVALPFYAVGSATENGGRALRQTSEQVWDSANGPLDISPETPTAQPAPNVPYDRDADRQPPADRSTTRNDDRRQDGN